jgi:hypothetical protein
MANKEYILYLDMDGVLCDFDGGYQRLAKTRGPKLAQSKEQSLEPMEYYKRALSFWSGLDWIQGGQELYEASTLLFERVCILSSAGSVDDLKLMATTDGKKLWLKKNIPAMKDENIFIVPGKEFKQKYANKGAILVDDKAITIKQFNAAGGYGILHRASHYKKTIGDLEDIALPMNLGELAKQLPVVKRGFWRWK